MKSRVLLGALALTVAVSALGPADAEAGSKHGRSRNRHHGSSIFLGNRHHGSSIFFGNRHHGSSIFFGNRHYRSRAFRYYAPSVIIAPRVYYDDYADYRYYDDGSYDDGYYDNGYDDDYADGPRSYRRGYYHVHSARGYCPYPQYRFRPHIAVGARGRGYGFYIRF